MVRSAARAAGAAAAMTVEGYASLCRNSDQVENN